LHIAKRILQDSAIFRLNAIPSTGIMDSDKPALSDMRPFHGPLPYLNNFQPTMTSYRKKPDIGDKKRK
jgi:hypothetical protein